MAGRKDQIRRILHFLWEGTSAETTPEEKQAAAQRNAEIYRDIYSVPSAQFYKKAADRTQWQAILMAALLGVLFGVAFTILRKDNIVIPLALAVAIVLPALLWRYPIFGFYLIFTMVCLIEVFPRSFSDSITDRVPLWFNGNMIIMYYGGGDPHALPFNLFEVLVILMGVMSLIRMAYLKNFTFRTGDLFIPILVYIGFAIVGWLHGITSGGDFNLSLQEVRSQVYYLIGYSMAVNMIESRDQVRKMFWIAAICIGIKGALYAFRRYITLAGQDITDQGVGSHEEAFFFDAYITLLLICFITKSHKKMTTVMLIMLPAVLLGNVATNRRAGTAAMVIAAPVLIAGCYAAFPARRKQIVIFTVIISMASYAYYVRYRESPSSIAQPARAIKSYFEPDDRDEQSNAYRDAENLNQFYTIQANPLGYGYGKPFLHVVPMVDISHIYELWDILPHNQILWVWMRTGTQGFYAFWIMMSLIIIRSCFFIRRKDITDEERTLGLMALTITPVLLLFGLFDLQLSNYRDMLMASIIVGASCAKIKGVKDVSLLKGTPELENSLIVAPTGEKARRV